MNKSRRILISNNTKIEDFYIKLLINYCIKFCKYNIKIEHLNHYSYEKISTKDKEVIKQQISFWPLKKIEKLITKISEVEIIIKKNSTNSINILCDFIINQSSKVNN